MPLVEATESLPADVVGDVGDADAVSGDGEVAAGEAEAVIDEAAEVVGDDDAGGVAA